MKRDRKHIGARAVLIAGWLASAPIASAQSDAHAGHTTAPAPVHDGPWSYKGRDNPAPYTHGRWEMVPSAKNGAAFISADKLSAPARCALLREHDYMAVDRATRAACEGTVAPAPAPPAADPHASHGH